MEDTATDPVALWAEHQMSLLKVKKWPRYGSPGWQALAPEDRRRAAAIVEAAELWRRHWMREDRLARLAEEDPGEWWREITAEANGAARSLLRQLKLSSLPTWDKVIAKRAQYGPIHEVTATPHWPPVAVPGRPGWSRSCGPDGEQIDHVNNRQME